jgi:predicted GIY-YIG superfamily endonuclease
MNYYNYLVECSDGSLYSGFTNNLEKRISLHNAGKSGSKYIFPRRPVKLVYFQIHSNKTDALKEEARIKKISVLHKRKLIENFNSSN